MRIALYKGKSAVSRAIRWVTRSPYSHAAFVFDESAAEQAARIAGGAERPICKLAHHEAGAVVEAWSGGVRNSRSVSTLHARGTAVDLFDFAPALTAAEQAWLLAWLESWIGAPYDYADVLRFLTRWRGSPAGRLFCSELVAQACADIGRPLFRATESWRVPPDWLARTVALRASGSVTTI